MFRVAILGTDRESEHVRRIVENVYNPAVTAGTGGEPIKVDAYVGGVSNGSLVKDGLAILTLQQYAARYHSGTLQALLTPREALRGQIWPALSRLRIPQRDVYVAQREDTVSKDRILSYLEAYDLVPYLSYLEFHIADHCNLNCRGCEHYSGLVQEPHFPVYEKFASDLRQLHYLIPDIGMIRILGGEPLLNPEIEKYLHLTRLLYPRAIIFVVTNALKLRQMPESFYKAMQQEQIAVHISLYPPMASQRKELAEFLQKRGIAALITDEVTYFTVKQTLTPHDDVNEIFADCYQAHCHNLYEGKIAACFLPFTTKYFNAYFHKQLPEDGAIDIYDPSLTVETLKKKLFTPFERCRYCTKAKPIPWSQMHQPSILSDWVQV